ncbi:MAG: CCA tRNA nucleotidyltransferase, partial [Parvibaculales bacterium]
MTHLQGTHSGWLKRKQTQLLLQVLNEGDATTRCVGGCVRDTLMGVANADTEVDMATDLPPKEVMARLKKAKIKCVPTGIKHGTVSAILYEGEKALVYEITTLRVDMTTDGRHAEVAFTDDWHGDAARRDFTINALYADADGTLHDPTEQGIADINAKRVRFIGNAQARIE